MYKPEYPVTLAVVHEATSISADSGLRKLISSTTVQEAQQGCWLDAEWESSV